MTETRRYKKNLKERGITLIALVITIIVLLILAGVSISTIVGENGLLAQASNAKNETEKSNVEEKVALAVSGAKTNKNFTITSATLEEELDNYFDEYTLTDVEDGWKLEIGEYEFQISNSNFEKVEKIEPSNPSEWVYTEDAETNTLTITGYTGTDTEIIIPNYIKGKKVKSIQGPGKRIPIFNNSTEVLKVTISKGIEVIAEHSFAKCTSLTEIIIPDSVKKLGYGMINGCTSLKEIKLPNSIVEVESYALAWSGIESIIFPESLTEIGYAMFAGSTSLTEVIIPDTITTIGDNAFGQCTALESITIQDGVKTISCDAFAGCTALESIIIPDSVTTIGARAFSDCTSLESIIISEYIETIEAFPFSGCTSLTLTVPFKSTDSVPTGWDSTWAGLDAEGNLIKIKYADT